MKLTAKWAVTLHGGAGNSKKNEDGCRMAAEVAARLLSEGETALDAAIRGVVQLEDDGRFNAGSGLDRRSRW